ncbi:B12-binding domain-containing radical SAM protein, partial [Candidatus Omnitrophota bacterium]
MEYCQNKKITISLISLYDLENNAIRSIAATLRNSGYRVFEIYFKNWINNSLVWPKKDELDNLITILRNTKTDLIGISLRASAYLKVAVLITEHIKRFLKVPIIWGGLHPTLVPEECIEFADMVCRGEGEYPMLELADSILKQKSINSIPNLWVKEENDIKKNEIRPLVQNLDRLS